MSASDRFQRFLAKVSAAIDPEIAAVVRGGELLQRAMHTKDDAALDEAIECLRGPAAGSALSDEERAEALSALGVALMLRFDRAGDRADRDGAIDAARRALAMRPPGHPHRGASLNSLTGMLTQRYMSGGGDEDIDAAVAAGREAVELTPEGHEHRATVLANLGAALRYRFERRGDRSDIEEAVEAAETAVESSAETDPRAVTRLSDLSSVLIARVRAGGGRADLDKAVDAATAAVRATADTSPHKGAMLNNLGTALRIRFDFGGEKPDLDAAIEAASAAVEATPAKHSRYPDRLTSLALTLNARFERFGADADLDAAIDALRTAALGTTYSRGTAVRLENLGAMLRARFARSGDSGDLDAAIDFLQRAVPALEPGEPHLATTLSNLGNAHLARSDRFGDLADLDAAVELGRQSVEATPEGHPHLTARLRNTATALYRRYEKTGDRPDIDEAVTMSRRAVNTTPDGHSRLASAWNLLSVALQKRFQAEKDPGDLREAVIASANAVSKCAPDEASRAAFLATLATAFCLQFELDGRVEHLDAAFAAQTDALAVEGAAVSERIGTARSLAKIVIERARAAGTASPQEAPALGLPYYRKAVDQLAVLAWRGMARDDHQHRLEANAAALGRDAAACAVASGDFEEAVRLSERSRSVWWGGVLDLRANLAELRTAHPALAAELEACRAVLDRPSASAFAIGFEADPEAPGRTARFEAGRRFDAIVAQIRALEPTEGFPHPERFLLDRAPDSASEVGDSGPVVLVNVSTWRCDALMVTGGSIEHVELPVTLAQVEDQTARYLEALGRYADAGPEGRFLLEMATRPVLEWMWEGIAGPVLERLGLLGEPAAVLPRVWWCPTGPLTLLPLHAAASRKNGGGAVIDQVVSSYTPTLRALAEARSRPAKPSPGRLLVSAIATTPNSSRGGHADLPGAVAERTLLAKLFGEDRRTSLDDERATRAAMLTELGRHQWAHFACHGMQDLADPGRGGLVPFDWEHSGLITVADLSSASAGAGEFAFLSACQTATGGVKGFDEAVNLSAAFHYWGWRHVIGTLWAVYDDSASRLAEHFYRSVVKDGELDAAGTARALHDAVQRLRSEHPNDTAAWARFIHSGP